MSISILTEQTTAVNHDSDISRRDPSTKGDADSLYANGKGDSMTAGELAKALQENEGLDVTAKEVSRAAVAGHVQNLPRGPGQARRFTAEHLKQASNHFRHNRRTAGRPRVHRRKTN